VLRDDLLREVGGEALDSLLERLLGLDVADGHAQLDPACDLRPGDERGRHLPREVGLPLGAALGRVGGEVRRAAWSAVGERQVAALDVVVAGVSDERLVRVALGRRDEREGLAGRRARGPRRTRRARGPCRDRGARQYRKTGAGEQEGRDPTPHAAVVTGAPGDYKVATR